jgi:hypothetical protein
MSIFDNADFAALPVATVGFGRIVASEIEPPSQ